ncbi:DUF937 domain-containing protein [uncultured Methylobacterium sp.]|uniref:DUF937 domain-containing protein n=1 Tax=uncultured Methylobacterium sp. TaxID=157278 RepID=UPI0035CBB96C
MFNPLDMLKAQNGAGLQILAQQFGLTPEQARRATESLMPAFALGMQRSPATDPTGLSQLFGLTGARPAAGPADTMLGQMFGSPALTQAILQQASTASGVGSQVLRQMLPAIAGAVVASIVHMLLQQQAPEPSHAPAPAPFSVNPVWAEMMKAFLPAAAPPERPQVEVRAPEIRPAPAAGADAASGMFGQMLRTGAEVQEQNIRAMQGLFEAFWTEAGAGETRSPPATQPEGPHRPRKGRGPVR